MQLNFLTKAAATLVLAWAFMAALPNVLPQDLREKLPSFAQKTVNLGLDLQGGAHLLLAVDMNAVLQRAAENWEDETRQRLRSAKLNYASLQAQNGQVTFRALKPAQIPAIKEALQAPEVNLAEKNGAFTLTFTDDHIKTRQETAVGQTVEVLRTRVDAFGVAEPVIQRQGKDKVIVQLPGIQDVQRAKDTIGKTAQLTFHLVDDTTRTPREGFMRVEDDDGFAINIRKRPSITGENLTNAAQGFDQNGQAAVDIAFDSRGTRLFGKLSTDNVNKRFAIMLDGKVLSAPVFREPILGGRAQISGSFQVQEAKDLSMLLNAGALPAPVEVVEERTVGPSLGADSVKAGTMAILIGFAIVLVFMAVFYGIYGLAANVALLFNVLLILAIMSQVGFTLTLPGMAGIVLTVGMAVDANVLIFERIREKLLETGQSPLKKVEEGFNGALSTILDANITTLIAAVVLFAMGSGPVKGFALTLSIGIISSLFTAIILTRWLVVGYVKRFNVQKVRL